MKKLIRNLLQLMAAIALVVVVGVSMVACGSNDGTNNSSNTTTNVNNIDNLNGFYINGDTNTKKVYYFDIANDYYKSALFWISDKPNQNGLYTLNISVSYRQNAQYQNRLRVSRGTQAVVVYKVWAIYPGAGANNTTKYNEDRFIATYQDEDSQDLSKQFRAQDDKLLYTKISGLDEFLEEVFPGKEFDMTNMSKVLKFWNQTSSELN